MHSEHCPLPLEDAFFLFTESVRKGGEPGTPEFRNFFPVEKKFGFPSVKEDGGGGGYPPNPNFFGTKINSIKGRREEVPPLWTDSVKKVIEGLPYLCLVDHLARSHLSHVYLRLSWPKPFKNSWSSVTKRTYRATI